MHSALGRKPCRRLWADADSLSSARLSLRTALGRTSGWLSGLWTEVRSQVSALLTGGPGPRSTSANWHLALWCTCFDWASCDGCESPVALSSASTVCLQIVSDARRLKLCTYTPCRARFVEPGLTDGDFCCVNLQAETTPLSSLEPGTSRSCCVHLIAHTTPLSAQISGADSGVVCAFK